MSAVAGKRKMMEEAAVVEEEDMKAKEAVSLLRQARSKMHLVVVAMVEVAAEVAAADYQLPEVRWVMGDFQEEGEAAELLDILQ